MLSLLLTAPAVLAVPAPAQDVDFLAEVYPIFEQRCLKCHGPKKQKGKLRLDRRELLFTPRDGIAAVVPGDLEESVLFELISLPADDPDIMPAEGEPLTARQIATLRAWIEQGAPFQQPSPRPPADPLREALELAELSADQAAARDRALAALGAKGIAPLAVAEGLEALEVNASLLRGAAGDAEAALLAGLEPVLVWANFSGTGLTDAGLETLGRCTELRRLNLSRTAITDHGLAELAGLKELTYLNLYGTAVTDAGLAHLAGLASLQKIFLWDTGVTDAGVERLAESLPGLRVNRGASLAAVDPGPRGGPLNTACPVTGKAVDVECVSVVDGRTIAFCCGECKASFDQDPEEFAAWIAALSSGPPTAGTPDQESLVGSWEGVLAVGAKRVRTVLHLSLDGDGAPVGTVDSPEQNAFGLELSELVFSDGSFSFRVPATQAQWEGRLEEPQRLVGSWRQRGADLELTFERVEVDPLVGTWEGTGDFGGIQLRIVFHVGTREDGRLGASMVSPDQSTTAVPVSSVEVSDDGSVRLDVAAARAVYEGRLDDGQTALAGHLLQGGARFELNLKKIGAPSRRARPQTPRPPFPYRSEEVSYENPQANNRLAGTLTLPEGSGPFPAALLISGSGAQDRDETLFGHKPFLVIADHLTRAGIAVLRVDDRGIGGSTGALATDTSEDFATDVRAGIDYLKSREDIRPDRIGLIGHSEGGLIAPMVASRSDDVAFIVLLAGPGVPGDQILYSQAALIAEASGAGQEAVEKNRQLQEQLFEILRTEPDPAVRRRRARAAILEQSGLEEGDDLGLVEVEVAKVASAWMRYFASYDPAPALRQVRCPVLAVNGALDLQVPAEENLKAIAAALEEGGNEDHQVQEFGGLNHLFQHCRTGLPGEYGKIEETFSPEVLELISSWISRRVLGK